MLAFDDSLDQQQVEEHSANTECMPRTPNFGTESLQSIPSIEVIALSMSLLFFAILAQYLIQLYKEHNNQVFCGFLFYLL